MLFSCSLKSSVHVCVSITMLHIYSNSIIINLLSVTHVCVWMAVPTPADNADICTLKPLKIASQALILKLSHRSPWWDEMRWDERNCLPVIADQMTFSLSPRDLCHVKLTNIRSNAIWWQEKVWFTHWKKASPPTGYEQWMNLVCKTQGTSGSWYLCNCDCIKFLGFIAAPLHTHSAY